MEQEKRPHLIMVCGPNGAGKSTLTSNGEVNLSYPIVDADKIAKDNGLGPLDAGKEADRQIKEHLDNKQSFVRESTLTAKYDFKLIEQAKQQGYYVSMVYVGVDSNQTSMNRVGMRHALGGHDVPKEDLLRRYSRSLENLPKAIKMVDAVKIYDNSAKKREEVALYKKGVIDNEYSTPDWYIKVKEALRLSERLQISPDNPAAVKEKIASVVGLADKSRGKFFEVGVYENHLISIERPENSRGSLNIKASDINNPKASVIRNFDHEGKNFSLNAFMNAATAAINSLKSKPPTGPEAPSSEVKAKKNVTPRLKP